MLSRLWQVSHILKGRGGEDGDSLAVPAWDFARTYPPGGPSCVTFGKSLTLSVFQTAGLTDGN